MVGQYLCRLAAVGWVGEEGFLSTDFADFADWMDRVGCADSTGAEHARASACCRGFVRRRSDFLNLRNLRNLRTNNLGREQHGTAH